MKIENGYKMIPVEDDLTGLVFEVKDENDYRVRIINTEIEKELENNPSLSLLRHYQRTLYHIQKRRVAVGHSKLMLIKNNRQFRFEIAGKPNIKNPLLAPAFQELLSIDISIDTQTFVLNPKMSLLYNMATPKVAYLLESVKKDNVNVCMVYEVPYEYLWMHENIDENLENIEENIDQRMLRIMKDIPIWTNYLSKLLGIGPRLGATLISTIVTPRRFNGNPGKLMRYAGFALDKFGNRIQRVKDQKFKVNTELKTALMGEQKVIDQFIMHKSRYAKIFNEYKLELTNKNEQLPEAEQISKGHIHNRAKWRIAKLFLSHLLEVWCKLENIPFREPYIIAELGHDKIPPFIDR